MRLYQTKQNLGGVPDSTLPTKDGANEYNSARDELENSATIAGLTPAPAEGTGEDTTQLAQALMINGAGASSFQASGTVDAITLTPVTGINGLRLPPDYIPLHGFRVGFYPIGTNTGNVTISIGQNAGSQFGVKKALNQDGSEIAASILSDAIYAEFTYDKTADTSNGAFVLIPYSLASGGGGVIATKVDKDLSSDVDYVPKVILDGTETIYIDDGGVSKKALVSNISSGDALKVDKDLSDNTTYPEKAALDGTESFFIDDNGTPKKSPASSVQGGWIKISAAVASASASLDFTGLDSNFSAYTLVFSDIAPATNEVDLLIQISTDGGSSYDTTGYSYAINTIQSGDSIPSALFSSNGRINGDSGLDSLGNAANEKASGEFTLYDPSAASYTRFSFVMDYSSARNGEINGCTGQGRRSTTTPVDAVRMILSSGNITSGKATLYGLVA